MRHTCSHPAVAVVLLLAVGCSTPPHETGLPHSHRSSITATITADAVLPTETITIPSFSAVVWRNRAGNSAAITIHTASCGTCETILGFQPVPQGARAAAVRPESVASICFHDAGTFHYTVEVGGRTLQGTIVVEGER